MLFSKSQVIISWINKKGRFSYYQCSNTCPQVYTDCLFRDSKSIQCICDLLQVNALYSFSINYVHMLLYILYPTNAPGPSFTALSMWTHKVQIWQSWQATGSHFTNIPSSLFSSIKPLCQPFSERGIQSMRDFDTRFRYLIPRGCYWVANAHGPSFTQSNSMQVFISWCHKLILTYLM